MATDRFGPLHHRQQAPTLPAAGVGAIGAFKTNAIVDDGQMNAIFFNG
jgi:hypothetical protein